MKKQIKLTKQEKLLSAYLGVWYRIYQYENMDIESQEIYAYVYSKLYLQSGQLKSEPFQIINGFASYLNYQATNLFGFVDLDSFDDGTKTSEYNKLFLLDMDSAMQNFSKEYIQPILTEQVFKELVSKFNLMLAIEKNETRQREDKRKEIQQQREQKLQKLKTF